MSRIWPQFPSMCAPQGVMACGMGGGAKDATGARPGEREHNSKNRRQKQGGLFEGADRARFK